MCWGYIVGLVFDYEEPTQNIQIGQFVCMDLEISWI